MHKHECTPRMTTTTMVLGALVVRERTFDNKTKHIFGIVYDGSYFRLNIRGYYTVLLHVFHGNEELFSAYHGTLQVVITCSSFVPGMAVR